MVPHVKSHKLHGKQGWYGLTHEMAWNHPCHIVPCMESYGNLVTLDPGFKLVAIFEIIAWNQSSYVIHGMVC